MVVFSIFFFLSASHLMLFVLFKHIYNKKEKENCWLSAFVLKNNNQIAYSNCSLFYTKQTCCQHKDRAGSAYTAVMQLCLCMQDDMYICFTDYNIRWHNDGGKYRNGSLYSVKLKKGRYKTLETIFT